MPMGGEGPGCYLCVHDVPRLKRWKYIPGPWIKTTRASERCWAMERQKGLCFKKSWGVHSCFLLHVYQERAFPPGRKTFFSYPRSFKNNSLNFFPWDFKPFTWFDNCVASTFSMFLPNSMWGDCVGLLGTHPGPPVHSCAPEFQVLGPCGPGLGELWL